MKIISNKTEDGRTREFKSVDRDLIYFRGTGKEMWRTIFEAADGIYVRWYGTFVKVKNKKWYGYITIGEY